MKRKDAESLLISGLKQYEEIKTFIIAIDALRKLSGKIEYRFYGEIDYEFFDDKCDNRIYVDLQPTHKFRFITLSIAFCQLLDTISIIVRFEGQIDQDKFDYDFDKFKQLIEN